MCQEREMRGKNEKKKIGYQKYIEILFLIHRVLLKKSIRLDFNQERIMEKHQIPSLDRKSVV